MSRIPTLRGALAGALLALALLSPAAASAATSTVGLSTSEIDDGSLFTIGYWSGLNATILSANVGAGSGATAGGTVTSWSMRTTQASGTVRLVVIKPVTASSYTIVQVGPLQTVTGTGAQTFAASLPIDAGDLVGVAGGAASARVSMTNGGLSGRGWNDWSPVTVAAGQALGAGGGSAGNAYALSATVTTPDPVVPATPSTPDSSTVDTTPTPAAPAPVARSAATAVTATAVRVQHGRRTARVSCGLDRGALLGCSVILVRGGTVVGTGAWTPGARTPRAGVSVRLNRAGRRLVRSGAARVTVRVVAKVEGFTLRRSERVKLAG